MLNQCVIVGRLVHIGKDHIVLKTARSYKEANGEYLFDSFNIYLSENILDNAAQYCKKGDVIGIKGRVESPEYEQDGKVYRQLKLIGEKVTFLSSTVDGTGPVFSKTQDIEDEEVDSDEEQ